MKFDIPVLNLFMHKYARLISTLFEATYGHPISHFKVNTWQSGSEEYGK